MIQRSLAIAPEKKVRQFYFCMSSFLYNLFVFQDEDWSKYIPTFAKSTTSRKKPLKVREKKPYTPFPPERPDNYAPSATETGKAFLKKKESNKKFDKNHKPNKRKSNIKKN